MFTNIHDIKKYMQSNNLEKYSITHNNVEFEFYLDNDDFGFSFDGPIWSSDNDEILPEVLDNGNLDEISDYIIEEGDSHAEHFKHLYESDTDEEMKKFLKTYLDQTGGKFTEIPDRNNVDWKNVPDRAIDDYQRLNLQIFNKKKAHNSFAYSVVKSVLDNNLDGAVIDYLKGHLEETPEIAKALKEFDDALQEKDLTKSWKAYQNLWDVHRNVTKRKYNKKSEEHLSESVPDENLDKIYKVLDDYMTKLGFNLVEDRKPYFINKKYIKADDTNYIHYIDFTPQMDNDQLKYEVRDDKGHQKLCNTYNILDAVDMDTSLKLIEFDMEGLE